MSDFKTKMHQIRFRLGLCPRPHCLLAEFKGPTSKGGKAGEGKGEREGKEGMRKKERGGRGKGTGMGGKV